MFPRRRLQLRGGVFARRSVEMALDRFQMRTKIRKRERTPRRVYAVDPVFAVSLQNVEFIVLDSLSLLNWEKKNPKIH